MLNEDETERLEYRKNSPFAHLKIKDDAILYRCDQRYTCSQCNKKMKYFCYYCFKVLGMDRSDIPKIKLPAKLDVIKHELELDGKSTALHARIIADNDVEVYNWKEMPEYEYPERVLMLFPGPDAKTLYEIPKDSFDRLIVIDGTWRQAKRIVRETPQLEKIQKVSIEPRLTYFWRFQELSPNYLSTIEAIYYLYLEYAEAYELGEKGSYDGRYDDLMFYYKYFYDLIQYSYTKGMLKDKKFTTRHKANYIKSKEEQ